MGIISSSGVVNFQIDDLVTEINGLLDHGTLSGLGDDDHTQYILVDGTRAFTGVVGGIDPTLSTHLATKNYVDTEIAGVVGGLSGKVGTTSATTFTITDEVVLLADAQTAAADITVTLPTAASAFSSPNSDFIWVKNSGDDSNNVIVDGNATETIDGSLTVTLKKGASITLVTDGSNWFIV